MRSRSLRTYGMIDCNQKLLQYAQLNVLSCIALFVEVGYPIVYNPRELGGPVALPILISQAATYMPSDKTKIAWEPRRRMRHMAARGGNSGDRRVAPTNETPECAQGKSVISPPMVFSRGHAIHPMSTLLEITFIANHLREPVRCSGALASFTYLNLVTSSDRVPYR